MRQWWKPSVSSNPCCPSPGPARVSIPDGGIGQVPEVRADVAAVGGHRRGSRGARRTSPPRSSKAQSVTRACRCTMHEQPDAEAWAAPIDAAERKVVGNKGYGAPPLDPCPWMDDGECGEAEVTARSARSERGGTRERSVVWSNS